MQHLNHSRNRSINRQVNSEPTTTVKKRTESSNISQNHQEPYKSDKTMQKHPQLS